MIRPCVLVRVSSFGTFSGKCTAFCEQRLNIFTIFRITEAKNWPFLVKSQKFQNNFYDFQPFFESFLTNLGHFIDGSMVIFDINCQMLDIPLYLQHF